MVKGSASGGPFFQRCNPVPGDEIGTLVTRGRGVSIHRTDCVNIINPPEDDEQDD